MQLISLTPLLSQSMWLIIEQPMPLSASYAKQLFMLSVLISSVAVYQHHVSPASWVKVILPLYRNLFVNLISLLGILSQQTCVDPSRHRASTAASTLLHSLIMQLATHGHSSYMRSLNSLQSSNYLNLIFKFNINSQSSKSMVTILVNMNHSANTLKPPDTSGTLLQCIPQHLMVS